MNLTEVLLAIALSLVLAVGALRSLHVFAGAEADLLAREKSMREISKLEGVLKAEVKLAQELFIFPGVRIQPGGRLTRSDGRPILTRGYSPAPNSDAITLGQLATETVFRRIADSLYCREAVGSRAQLSLSDFRAYLGVGLTGVAEGSAKLTLLRRLRAPTCPPGRVYRGTWQESSDAIFVSPELEPMMLVPFVDIFTLSLDSDALLRRHSHLSRSSQAVCGPFESLRLHVDADTSNLVAEVTAESDRPAGRVGRTLRIPFDQSRAHPLDLLS